MGTITLFHGSIEIIEYPEIRIGRDTKDFYWGFYCTLIEEQAIRWATRFGKISFINIYNFNEANSLKVLKFPEMSEEWLDFIVNCRYGGSHDYDIVEGAMADDTIFNYIQNFIDEELSSSRLKSFAESCAKEFSFLIR